MFRKAAFVAAIFALPGSAVLAQNTTAANARMVVPDGSQYTDSVSGTNYHWFSTVLEGGHSYAVEAYNSNDALGTNYTKVDLWESNGTTPFLVENGGVNTGSCAINNTASPSLDATTAGVAGTGTDGARCLLYPLLDNNAKNRVVKIRVYDPDSIAANVNQCLNCFTRVRVRETTIISRWSVNGYNMFVALHNESAIPGGGVVLYYGDAPLGPASTVAADFFALQGLNSVQFVHNSLSLTPNHGSVHILVSGIGAYGGVEFDVQTYAFSTTANNFNVFVPHRPSHGGQSSVGYGE